MNYYHSFPAGVDERDDEAEAVDREHGDHGGGEPDVVAHRLLEGNARQSEKWRASGHRDPQQREWQHGHPPEHD